MARPGRPTWRSRRSPKSFTTSTSRTPNYGRDEAGGMKTLLAGLVMAHRSAEKRLARGSEIFDDLYEYFGKKLS